MSNAQHSSASNEHYTPLPVIEMARHTLGDIDLDPASSQRANEDIKAKYYFTDPYVHTIGLPRADEGKSDATPHYKEGFYRRDWQVDGEPSCVFLNPPGGRVTSAGRPWTVGCGEKGQSNQKRWWNKLVDEWVKGNVRSAVYLGFSIEILQSAQNPVEGFGVLPFPTHFPFCIPKRRLAFDTIDPVTNKRISGSAPTHANVIVFLPGPDNLYEFGDQFSELGAVTYPFRPCTDRIVAQR